MLSRLTISSVTHSTATAMLFFADAKQVLAAMLAALTVLVA